VSQAGKHYTQFARSAEALKFARDAQKQLPPACRVMFDCAVCVTLRMFYPNQRSDLDESIVLDALQAQYRMHGGQRVLLARGVYMNDRQVKEKHVYWNLDRSNPRVEVVVEPLGNVSMEGAAPVQPELTGGSHARPND